MSEWTLQERRNTMVNEYMKLWSTSLIREMKIKTTVKLYTPIRHLLEWFKLNITSILNTSEDGKQL